ncbi:FkbM family methyltransferase [Pseudanabaena sp. 'Roaring Creek']|uniref:FkbM family methyltransferase n=1 Tax=Pseudanabaena sp. 'Roaring Creek' TaxID=1681830 RepID=UPI0006D7F642|nr:FkbM family methyltransferase [Pseudanabaena sp. 'Roaring Creek']
MSIFLSILKKDGFLDRIHMTLCNVGSRKLGDYDDYASKGWGLFVPNLTIYGFDADSDACEAANSELESRHIDWQEVHIPLALGKAEEERTLYITKAPMCSSLYPPNEPYLKRFAGLPELVNLDFSCQIQTNTLDDFCELEGIDEINFLQIDVQGADLDVLQGANRILDSILAIQIEVEFSHLYVDQPLFADVDTFLRSQGFTLFDISTAYRVRSNSPIRSTQRAGQLLWGDAFYFRDPIQSHNQNPDQILELACIADILNFPDYALELLEYLTLNYGKDRKYNLAMVIVEGLSQFPELVKQGLGSLPIVSRIQDFLTDLDIPSSLSSLVSIPK